MNNLHIFRKAVNTFAEDSCIDDVEKWKNLMEYLCDQKILHPQQVKQLNQNVQKRQFPITVTQLEQLIMREFGDQSNKNLLNDLNSIQKQIRQAKGVLAVWKEQGLTSAEIKALEVMFAKGNNKMKHICNLLREKKELLESISQQEVQMIKSMNQWTVMQRVEQEYANYQEYQKINQKAIDKLFGQLRVREVHFRSKKIPPSAYQKVTVIIGYNSKTDSPVEVTKIPKKFTDFQQINTTLVTFNAQRDLMLSPYFVRFLGYNNTADPHFYMYFRQNIQTKNMLELINGENSIRLEENMPLYQFWAGQIFRALRDIFYMSSYMPILPIRLQDFEVADYGLKVILKHCRFQSSREPQFDIQADLLQNVGMLLLALLGCTEISQIQKYVHNIQNRCLITGLLRAKVGRQRYQQKIIPCYINFFNAQTHQLFESNQQKQGMEIIDNFTVLFSDQIMV